MDALSLMTQQTADIAQNNVNKSQQQAQQLAPGANPVNRVVTSPFINTANVQQPAATAAAPTPGIVDALSHMQSNAPAQSAPSQDTTQNPSQNINTNTSLPNTQATTQTQSTQAPAASASMVPLNSPTPFGNGFINPTNFGWDSSSNPYADNTTGSEGVGNNRSGGGAQAAGNYNGPSMGMSYQTGLHDALGGFLGNALSSAIPGAGLAKGFGLGMENANNTWANANLAKQIGQPGPSIGQILGGILGLNGWANMQAGNDAITRSLGADPAANAQALNGFINNSALARQAIGSIQTPDGMGNTGNGRNAIGNADPNHDVSGEARNGGAAAAASPTQTSLGPGPGSNNTGGGNDD